MNSSVTRLEEATSISPDLLLGREYKIHRTYGLSCRSSTHKLKSTNLLIETKSILKLTKSTDRSKDKKKDNSRPSCRL